MRIFVTGATGVVGRRAVPLLVAAGHEVTGVARTREKAAELKRVGATPVRVDLFDADAVRAAVAGHEVVINLTTAVPPGTKVFMPGAWRQMDRIRRNASAILADAAIAGGVERFIQESFAPIYAEGGDAWVDESAPVRPARYNRSVLDAERSAARVTQARRTGVVLRFGYFYGPDAGPALDSMIAFARKGRASWFGGPDGYLSAVSHDDAATAVIAALDLPAGIYNVVDDEPLRRRDYFGALASALGAPRPKFFPAWMRHLVGSLGETMARSQRMSNRKLRDASGWRPAYPSVREGWPATIRQWENAKSRGGAS
jgi:nucleoside-diphosphate-sugar epimerase